MSHKTKDALVINAGSSYGVYMYENSNRDKDEVYIKQRYVGQSAENHLLLKEFSSSSSFGGPHFLFKPTFEPRKLF